MGDSDRSPNCGNDLGPSDLPRIKEELVATQERLAELLEASTDPLAELSVAEELRATWSRRDLLLEQMGRIMLRWMMDGGQVELVRGLPRRTTRPRPTPPPTAPEPTGPKAEPLSAEQLARVVDNALVAPAWTEARQTAPREGGTIGDTGLAELIEPLVVSPTPPQQDDFVVRELARLTDSVDGANLEQWRIQPRTAQRALVGLITARSRHVQDERGIETMGPVEKDQLDRLFSVLTAYSKREQPGFVYGLQRSHRPVADTWWDDAYRWWRTLEDLVPAEQRGNPEQALDALATAIFGGDADAVEEAVAACLDAGVDDDDPRLLDMLEDQNEVLQRKARFKRVRKALRDLAKEDAASEAELDKDPAHPEPEWPFWDQVRGKHAAIIGGDSREHARQRIAETFELSEAEWVTTDHSRNLQTLKDAVLGGRIDLVIVLRRFIGHDVDRVVLPACKEAGVPWVSVDRGYGTTQVRQAMERFLNA